MLLVVLLEAGHPLFNYPLKIGTRLELRRFVFVLVPRVIGSKCTWKACLVIIMLTLMLMDGLGLMGLPLAQVMI